MRKAIWLLAAGIGLTVLGPTAPAPAAESAQVMMVDNEPDLTRWHFDPAEITVPAGANVVWLNKGKEDHTVTADDKSFDSGMKRPGTSFLRTFPKPGRYTYYCAPHPWMKGAVRVVGATSAAATRGASEATPTTAAPPPPSTAPVVASTTTRAVAGTPAPVNPAAPAGADNRATGNPATDKPATGDAAAEDAGDAEDVAAPAGSGDDSGDSLPGTLAIVLIPTLGGLALGAKLRQRSASSRPG